MCGALKPPTLLQVFNRVCNEDFFFFSNKNSEIQQYVTLVIFPLDSERNSLFGLLQQMVLTSNSGNNHYVKCTAFISPSTMGQS